MKTRLHGRTEVEDAGENRILALFPAASTQITLKL